MRNKPSRSKKKKEYINMSDGRIIHILFHEQAVCKRGTKWKKIYLMSISKIAFSTVSRPKVKRGSLTDTTII